MIKSSTSNPSLWMLNADAPRRAALAEDVDASACVVGAGYAGLSCAYFLAKAGRSVVVIDDGGVAGGESALTTAHHTALVDPRYADIESTHGLETARVVADAHSRAIDAIESIAESERIDCGFERLDGFLLLAPGRSLEELRKELDAARRAGLEAELVEKIPTPGFPAGPALRLPRQAQSHPVKYLLGLAAAIERLGGRIYERTHAASIEDGDPARVVTAEGRVITAETVVVATNVPVNDRLVFHTRQFPYRTYVATARVPAGSVPKGLYWDTAEPYHYVRLAPGEEPGYETLVIGGEDHKTGQADDAEARWARLGLWARERFPSIERMERAWSGQVVETADGLAFIGRNPGERAVYVVSALSGNGTTYGTVAGMIIADLARGKTHPWAEAFSPLRPKTRGAGEWVRENANAVARYGRYLKPSERPSIDDIPRGSGAVMRRGLRKVAVYRDENGVLSELSAICPHLGGVVCWNPGEKSWDCPVHGSRFSPTGEVLNGPANSNLPPVPETRPRRRRRAPRGG